MPGTACLREWTGLGCVLLLLLLLAVCRTGGSVCMSEQAGWVLLQLLLHPGTVLFVAWLQQLVLPWHLT